MPYLPDPTDVALAFGEGSTEWMGRPVTFSVHEIGKLSMTTGAITASDPLVAPDTSAFARHIDAGTYPVTLAVAAFGGDSVDERVAYARLNVTAKSPVSWEPAVWPGQDVAQLGADEFFGYGVDSGTGCFMDGAAAPLLAERMAAEDYLELIDDLQVTYRPTWSWLDLQPNPARGENVIFFSTGWGDGSYPTFFGLDETGQVAAVLTDFMLLGPEDAPESDPPTATAATAPPRRPWWQFWRS